MIYFKNFDFVTLTVTVTVIISIITKTKQSIPAHTIIMVQHNIYIYSLWHSYVYILHSNHANSTTIPQLRHINTPHA